MAVACFDPFAVEVIDISINSPYEPNYLPAPGQRINVWSFNIAENALGSPNGGGTQTPNNDGIVTLGGFGGQIILVFEQDVENNSANPFGLDAIVFSNTLWYEGDPNLHWAEFATIEIMPELNGNSIPGDYPGERWYLIPGSHLSEPNDYRSQFWDRYDPNLFGYPNYTAWPDTYETSGFELFPNYENVGSEEEPIWLLVNPYRDDGDPNNDYLEGYWGYAEYTPTLKLGDRDADDLTDGYGDCPNMLEELFYTVPDDPCTLGITAGSCGGDAFDISWAVDSNSFEPANLDSFRYIRITTAVHEREFGDEGILGEISAEIDGVADVRPFGDINGDQDIDNDDLYLFSLTWLSQWPDESFNPAADFVVDNKIDFKDYTRLAFGYQ